MQIVKTFPYQVEVIENEWIPMSDGFHLAARMWLPKGSEKSPVPAILEYIPYRKRDFKRNRDAAIHGYFAGHGYACVRVDIRGSGDSEGVLTDEYLEQELVDGEDILSWIAAQDWCDGNIGIIGISWGGFNGLQLAARQPPELKTVITLCSTDDRYADDVHYMGGCLLGDNLSWSAVMFSYNSLPPDPQIVGGRWFDMWMERLKGSGLWLDTWLRHQQRDSYWQHGSICENFSAVRCPVLAASGWADGYSNAVFRLLEHLDVPRKGLIGPWSHRYPHQGRPGPAIGFLQECLRWWDKWLKGQETGIMDEPMLRVWMLESVEPTTSYSTRPGRWVAETEWPSPQIRSHEFTLGWRHIAPGFGDHPEVEETIRSPLTVGLFAGKWCSYSATPDLPHDQRQEDGGALVFESEPLAQRMEILGGPVVELELFSDQPVAMVAARLSDVAPDDKATRVTYGLQNLTHLHDHQNPKMLDSTRRYRVQVKLNHIAQVFPVGHRFRISISTSYWPLAWAPPRPVCLTIITGLSRLTLPVRTAREEDDLSLHHFPSPEQADGGPRLQLCETDYGWHVTRDLEKDISTLKVIKDEGCYRLEDIDLEVRDRATEVYSSCADDFTSLRGEVVSMRSLKRGDWYAKTETRTVLTCTEDAFHLHADLDAFLDGDRVYCKTWNRIIQRDHL